jgi:hypothetical protein
MALPFLTGQLFSNTKDTTVTKGKPMKSTLFSLFVYLAPFVVRLFPVNDERTRFIQKKRQTVGRPFFNAAFFS